jgi:DHA1 family inner membrane transport protein
MASEHHRGRALSVVNSGITIAFVVGVPLGTYLAYALGWRAAFWFLAGLGTIATIGLAWSLPAEVRLSKVTSLGQRVAILLTPSVLLLVAVTIFSYAGVFTIYTYLAPALRAMTGLSGGALSSVLLIFGLTSIVGNWVGGVLTDLSSPARTMLVSFVCLAAILLFFPVMMASTASAVLLVGVVGFLHYTALTPLQHRFTLVQPEQCDVVIGLCFSAFYIGIAAASYIGGYVVANYGVADLGYAASGLKLAAAGALLLSLARHRLVQPATVATVATPRP